MNLVEHFSNHRKQFIMIDKIDSIVKYYIIHCMTISGILQVTRSSLVLLYGKTDRNNPKDYMGSINEKNAYVFLFVIMQG